MPDPEGTRTDYRERWINAPQEEVFAAFSNPDRLAKWWGPEGFTSTYEVFEFRPGGHWRFTMHGPDGKDYWNESILVEIVANEKVVIEHHSGHHFILTITYKPDREGTLIGWRQEFDTSEHFREIAEFIAQANEQNLDKMEAEVMRSGAGA